jgi:hypothetical protein
MLGIVGAPLRFASAVFSDPGYPANRIAQFLDSVVRNFTGPILGDIRQARAEKGGSLRPDEIVGTFLRSTLASYTNANDKEAVKHRRNHEYGQLTWGLISFIVEALRHIGFGNTPLGWTVQFAAGYAWVKGWLQHADNRLPEEQRLPQKDRTSTRPHYDLIA